MTKIHFNRITILGVGLIGASFARAMKKNGFCDHITGFGRNTSNLINAVERGIIDSFESDPALACEDADMIMFSTPVGSFTNLAEKSRPAFKKGSIVTDVGSVKGNLVYEMERLMPEGVHYIGGHPIAGSDHSGIDSSNAELFRNAKYIITPTENSEAGALETVSGVWRSLGSNVLTMTPEKHDRIYAAVSHLPHIIAYAIVNAVAEIDNSYLGFCGQGFKDTTRIASSPPELWRDISLLNRDNLIESISIFRKNLDMLEHYLSTSDAEALEGEFKKARALRDGIGPN
ncbi:MAG: prephenate dehydrogenase/arogenate dehydrogenase family protein [Nitrospirota bacterium]|nr:prephenate dehydrogenase/arogenate dehydrogenase family protein [Nitrospirota bacterium]